MANCSNRKCGKGCKCVPVKKGKGVKKEFPCRSSTKDQIVRHLRRLGGYPKNLREWSKADLQSECGRQQGRAMAEGEGLCDCKDCRREAERAAVGAAVRASGRATAAKANAAVNRVTDVEKARRAKIVQKDMGWSAKKARDYIEKTLGSFVWLD